MTGAWHREATSVAILDELARFARLEERIGESESTGLRARWEFGREMLALRDGKGRLPNGFLTTLAERTGASLTELTKRQQFAQRFPSEDELRNAITKFGSWFRIVRDALPSRRTDDGAEPGPLAEGTFRAIVADPPWKYDNQGTRAATSKHYATLTVDELCALEVDIEDQEPVPVVDLAADGAHLYLWVTNGFLRQAFEVVDAWGFTYRTCLTWVKRQWGIGNYFRPKTEHIYFCTRGRLPIPEGKREANVIEARRTGHSVKPDAFYDMVERVSPGPRLEMFSRRRRLGWTSWGLEA